MADMLDGGAGEGMVGQFPLEQWFYEMPICTRIWTVATLAMSVLVQCRVLTALQLFYSVRAVFIKNQVHHKPTEILSDLVANGRHAYSSGVFSPISFTLVLYLSTCYFIYTSFSATRGSSKNPPAAHLQHIRGSLRTQPPSSWFLRRLWT